MFDPLGDDHTSNPERRALREIIYVFAVCLGGIVLRAIAVVLDVPRYDGAFYSTIGYDLASGHGLANLVGNTTYSFSLTLPAFLAVTYWIGGFSLDTTRIAAFAQAILAMVVTYFTTRDLFGAKRAWFATALVAAASPLVVATGKNYVENLVIVFSVPAFWAVLRSFNQPKYLPVAAVFAGLTYYTKTNVGLATAIAAMAAIGILWFYYERWKIFRRIWYYFAAGIVSVFVLIRSYLVATSDPYAPSLGASTGQLVSPTGAASILIQLSFEALLLVGICSYFVPELRSVIRDWRKRPQSFLLLSVAGLTLAIVLHAATYPLFSTVPISGVGREYLTVVYVPVLWLVFLHARHGQRTTLSEWWARLRTHRILILSIALIALAALSLLVDDWIAILLGFAALAVPLKSWRQRASMLIAAMLLLSANAVTAIEHPATWRAAQEINRTVQAGDDIALLKSSGSERLSGERIFPYLSRTDVTFSLYTGGNASRFVISEVSPSLPGYALIGTFYDEIRPSVLRQAANLILNQDPPNPPPIFAFVAL